jgi:hypothetical protein
MPTFLLKVRKTLADEIVSVDAPTREEAIVQIVHAAGEGESVEVLDSEELPAGPTGMTGVSGTSGTSGTSGASGASGASGPTGMMG